MFLKYSWKKTGLFYRSYKTQTNIYKALRLKKINVTLSPSTDSSVTGGQRIAILFTALQHSSNSKSSMLWKLIQYLDKTYAVIRKKSLYVKTYWIVRKLSTWNSTKMTTKLKRQMYNSLNVHPSVFNRLFKSKWRMLFIVNL